MKTKLFLICIALSFAFIGCEKCKDCTTTTVISTSSPTPGYPQTTTTDFEACGKDLKDVDGKTYTSTSSSGSMSATGTATTICK